MILHRFWPRGWLAVAVLLAVTGMLAAGCGGGSSTKPPSSSKRANAAVIKADWQKFFSASTPAAEREGLLENGSRFASVIKAQVHSSLAKGASAKVKRVTVHFDSATVVYTILFGGHPVFKKTGRAVLQGGKWKVATSSFCGLLALEQQRPAACRGG